MNRNTVEMLNRLHDAGISTDDALALRRIAMTLQRWHELECGDDTPWASRCISRGHKKNGAFEYDDNGKPYLECHPHSTSKPNYWPIPDRERGALKRLAKIMAKYDGLEGRPILASYVQTDPRGAPLYILRQRDISVWSTDIEKLQADISANYSRGIAVYK